MKKAILGALFAGAMLASCSSDEPVVDNGGNNEGDIRYLAVNIVTPKETGTRTATDGNFEIGSENEDAASTGVFVLFKGNTVTQVTTPQSLEPWKGLGDYNPNVENISSAVLLVENASDDSEPTSLLAILNAPSTISTDITAGKKLSDVEAIVGNYAASGAKGSFIMTNSVYLDNEGQKQIAADTEGKFAKTPDAAKNNPVDIYVERVVAKIKTSTSNSNITVSTNEKVTIGTTEIPVTIDVKGVQIANCAQTSYLFKNITGFTTSNPWSGWSEASNKRSYWAVTPTNPQYDNLSWNEISGVGEGNNALAINTPHDFYVQENVFLGTTKPIQNTSVIVTAQLKKADGNALELVKIAGVYYTQEDGLTQVINSLNNRHYVIEDTEKSTETSKAYKSIPADYFEWAKSAPSGATDVKGWEGFAKLKDNKNSEKFYMYDATITGANKYVEKTATDVNNALCDKALRAQKWTNGMCYYFVDIEHFGTETTGEGENAVASNRKGIIRNHIYDLNLQSISGLGVPVFDPEEDIVPEIPDDDKYFYLAARINILKWKVVKQNVDFNN